MAREWYYAKGGQQHGPVSDQQLKELAASGQIQPSDFVWCEDMTDWAKASTSRMATHTLTSV
jgi:hypothetical protein